MPLTPEEKDHAANADFFGPPLGMAAKGRLWAVAKVARSRGARLVKQGDVMVSADLESEEIIKQARKDVAAWLGLGSPEDYERMTPGQRRVAIARKTMRERSRG